MPWEVPVRTRARLDFAAREFYWTHPAVQRGYGRVTALQGARSQRRGDWFLALNQLCDAPRRLHPREPGNQGLRARGLQRLGEFVRAANGGELPATPADNRLVEAFLASPHAEGLRRKMRRWSAEERLSLRGNLMVLKPPQPRERGVLLVFFTHMCEMFLTLFDLRRLFDRFTVVLEPSWGLAPEPYWAYFAARDTPALCQAMTDETAAAITATGLPLVPLPFGAQDWVDGDLFRPLGLAKEFDVVMVASFARLKRHAVLYRALRRLPGPRLKVALVGHAWERTQEEFEAEMEAHGVRQDCTLFRNVEADQVNEILNRSRAAVLLTRIEGGNRALMEALAADVPVVVYRHIVGPRLQQINPQTGRFASDRELGTVLAEVVRDHRQFHPRQWFEANTGYRITSQRLNQALRHEAARRGEDWSRDIAVKMNSPMPAYADPRDADACAPAWRELESMVVFR